jgi:hypothetical protein
MRALEADFFAPLSAQKLREQFFLVRQNLVDTQSAATYIESP